MASREQGGNKEKKKPKADKNKQQKHLPFGGKTPMGQPARCRRSASRRNSLGTMAETAVCAVSDVPENSVKRFEVGTAVLAVYNIGGSFYATDDECTHGAASLADGILEGDVIECTMHFGAFNVKTGEAVQSPCSCRCGPTRSR